jgi:hypothetical protein
LACSRVGTRHALCDTNAVRWNVAIKRVLTRSLDLCRRSMQLLRACMHPNTKFSRKTKFSDTKFSMFLLQSAVLEY